MKTVKAFAPATVANVAVGFDILGFALKHLGETATVEKTGKPVVTIEPVAGYDLPTDPLKNTATAGLVHLIKDKKLNFGFHVKLEKNIPVGSGLGGSSTSAVAAIVAANAFLKKKLTYEEMLEYALTGEAVASGARHADNVGPCLYGGLTLIQHGEKFSVTKIKTPASLKCVVLLPDIEIHTKSARQMLNPNVPLPQMIEQTANLAGFVLGCQTGNMKLIQNSLRDVVIEPQRSKLIPGFANLQEVAMKAGALGCSISGSGPAIFALAANSAQALKIKKNFMQVAERDGLFLKGIWISSVSEKGAHILKGRA